MTTTTPLPLFYPERLNMLFGESGTGKTWIGYAGVTETAARARRILVLDWEDSRDAIVDRLYLLGIRPAEIALVDYRNPSTGLAMGINRLQAEITEPVDLVIVDSVGEAMAAGGVNSNDDAEVAVWFNLCRRLTRLPGGPAVVLLDHIPKSNDAPQMYAIGSQRKRAAINGAAYRVDTLIPSAMGKDGKWKITVAKDRIGNRAARDVAAEVEVTSTEDTVRLYFHSTLTQEAKDAGDPFRPTGLMTKVSEFLVKNPGASRAVIEREVKGRSVAMVRLALEILVNEDYVRVEAGPRKALFHYSEREYSEMADLIARPRPTSSDLVPTPSDEVPTPLQSTSSTSSPPVGDEDVVDGVVEPIQTTLTSSEIQTPSEHLDEPSTGDVIPPRPDLPF